MTTNKEWRWGALVSVLTLVPSLAISQGDPGDPDPGLAAFGAGDFRKAHDLWQPEARLGDPTSQFYLGYLYETGKGIAMDYGMALYWYNESAKNECRIAECNLGNLYMNGRGAAVNHDEAIRRFSRCIRAGGTCNEHVVKTREFVAQRLTWYADQGYADAQYELAGMAVDRGDFAGAAAWLQKAAQRQHGPAQVALADSYLNGAGIDQDIERGVQLLFQAMVQHRENTAVLRSAKTTLASAYYAGHIDTTKPAISAYIWARLALEEYPETDSLPGMMYDMMATEAKKAMTDGELGTAFFLASRWTELFATGLPGVTEEHLRTLAVPE